MKRNVCVITGSRADYGLLRGVMEGIRAQEELKLQVVATGSHLSAEFGLTCREIQSDGIPIDRRVETLLSADNAVAVAKAIGLGLIGMGDVLRDLSPDIVVVLGDRFEIFAAAAAAMVAGIPLAHIHGGETSEGSFDEAIRHSITKMSHLHFVATEVYRHRVIQLGEQPSRVFNVGGLGVDAIRRMRLLDRPSLEHELEFQFGERNLLVTFHPATLEKADAPTQLAELLEALSEFKDIGLIFTMPNADPGSRELALAIDRFVGSRSNARAYSSLGQLRYLSCIRQVDGVIGNSSSGLTEVPSFRKGTINIGDRQKGRLKGPSVIDCEAECTAIRAAIHRLFSPVFQSKLLKAENPYGEGGACDQIVQKLRTEGLENIVKKSFHDLSF